MSLVRDVSTSSSAEVAPESRTVPAATPAPVDPPAPARNASRHLWAPRAFRPDRAPAGVLVAATLGGAAWTLAVELVAAASGLLTRPSALWPPLRRVLLVTFGDPLVPGVAIAMIVSGVGLVMLAVLPGRPRLIPLESDDPLLAMGLTRAGLRRTLAAAARAVDGVRHARVRVLPRRIEVNVVIDTGCAGVLLREVGAAVGDRLAGLRPRCRHDVVVRLRRRRG